ncbi:glycosyltransferase family 2 protein [Marihabitans asiaticum]|uniref:4,4'-diaponeurosporenoate glycosyltransferase n=1 Tax=Marihabitans asiaticum TaxID=415218 RepID=A0A560WA59_9MICO|nr:glycosyltransferase family 2 protein [Marihabitans asiaticum]TWD14514.1 glycosyl transferase family 2 [Marihabitans asiaticum]
MRAAVDAAALPSVSVVIPARDDAPALRTCLALLARQSLAPLEVVVVDNASQDETAAVARAAGAVVLHEAQVGIPPATAAGYDAARGEVIARLDADSRPGPRWVERVAREMADPQLSAVTGWGTFYDLPRPLVAPAAALYLGAYYLLSHLALGHTVLWGSSMALRRSVWVEVRGEVHRDDPDLHDDMDLAFVLGPSRRIRLAPGLRVEMSARSLRGGEQVRRRFVRAVRTLEVNWRVHPPWLRWRDRGVRLRRAVKARAGRAS